MIALGYGESQGVSHKIKTMEQVSNATSNSPSWFRKGVEAALLAPTAINQQKFSFFLQDQEGTKAGCKPKVLAKRGFSMVGYTKMDLGIAKLHFEIGAGKENFNWVVKKYERLHGNMATSRYHHYSSQRMRLWCLGFACYQLGISSGVNRAFG